MFFFKKKTDFIQISCSIAMETNANFEKLIPLSIISFLSSIQKYKFQQNQ